MAWLRFPRQDSESYLKTSLNRFKPVKTYFLQWKCVVLDENFQKWTNTTSDSRSTEVKMGRIVRTTFCCHHFRKNYFRNNHKHENIKVHDNITLFLRNEKYKMLWTFFLLWNAVKCLFIVRVVHAKNKTRHLTVWQKNMFFDQLCDTKQFSAFETAGYYEDRWGMSRTFSRLWQDLAKISGWE